MREQKGSGEEWPARSEWFQCRAEFTEDIQKPEGRKKGRRAGGGMETSPKPGGKGTIMALMASPPIQVWNAEPAAKGDEGAAQNRRETLRRERPEIDGRAKKRGLEWPYCAPGMAHSESMGNQHQHGCREKTGEEPACFRSLPPAIIPLGEHVVGILEAHGDPQGQRKL